MKKILITVLITLLLISGDAFAKRITLVTLDSAPLEYKEGGKVTGRNVELAQLALKKMGHESVVKLVPWKRALKMVETGKADGIIDAGFNEKRAKYMYYPPENIYLEEIALFKRKSDNFKVDPKFNNAVDGLMYMRIADLPEGTVKPVMEEFQAELEQRVNSGSNNN